jgi:hypothetical protein
MKFDSYDVAKLVFESAEKDVALSLVIAEKTLEFLKKHADGTCDHRTDWICDRNAFFGSCEACPAINDKTVYELEQAEIAKRTCHKRNMMQFGDFKITDDCFREGISVGDNGKNCDECPAYEDLLVLLGDYKIIASKKDENAYLAAEKAAIQTERKIRLILAWKRHF